MSIPADFDPAERAERAKQAERRRDHIAENTERLMAYAKREGWGEVEGLPVLTGTVLVYHFTSGRRGIVRLPIGTEFE